jgi:hypothetical protein
VLAKVSVLVVDLISDGRLFSIVIFLLPQIDNCLCIWIKMVGFG